MNDLWQSGSRQSPGPQGGDEPSLAAPGQVYVGAPGLQPEDGWGTIGIIMVALAVVFAGGVGYFLLSGPDVSEPESKAEVADVADAGPQTKPGEDIATDAEADDSESNSEDTIEPETQQLRANGVIDRPAGLVSLSLESEPLGALVIRERDGVRLGKTPYLYEVEASDGSIRFVLELAGYQSAHIQMPANRDGVRQVLLLPGGGGGTLIHEGTGHRETRKSRRRRKSRQ